MADLSSYRIWILHADAEGCDVAVARSYEEAHELSRCTESSRDCPAPAHEIDVELASSEQRPRILQRNPLIGPAMEN